MIAGTGFIFCGAEEVARVTHRLAKVIDSGAGLRRVAEQLKEQTAVPLLCDEALIVITLKELADGTIAAHILLGVSFGKAGAFKRQESALIALAKDAGADWLTFKPGRRGWSRALGEQWKLEDGLYVRKVT